ncbi:hypothetical protein CerSpe_156840 [Prunus speciosa]
MSWVYGTPYLVQKVDFWRWMENMLTPHNQPWFVGGDFNEWIWNHEKEDGMEDVAGKQLFLLDFINSVGLTDLGFQGPTYTWRAMRRNQSLIQERLDCDLANPSWLEQWPHTKVTHGPVIGSDHCPLIVIAKPKRSSQKNQFMFEATWLEHQECRAIIEEC